jgi:DNA polymerase-3 subunit delta'
MAVQITNLADGNMREAYRMVNEEEDQYTGIVRDWLRACYSVDINAIFAFVEKIVEKDKESQKSLLLSGINIVREVMLDKSTVGELMRSADTERDFIHKLGKNVLDGEKLQSVYSSFNEAHYHLERNANAKILFADLSFQLARIMKSNLAATA